MVGTRSMLLLAALVAVPAGAATDLAGAWQLNAQASESPRPVRELLESEERIRGARARRSDRQAERGWPDGDGRAPGDRVPPSLLLLRLLVSDVDLTIHQSEPRFRFSYGDGRERVFYSDRRGQSVSALGGNDPQPYGYAFAIWEGDTLLVESRRQGGLAIFERYRVLPESRQLELQVTLLSNQLEEDVIFRRVFDYRGPPPPSAEVR